MCKRIFLAIAVVVKQSLKARISQIHNLYSKSTSIMAKSKYLINSKRMQDVSIKDFFYIPDILYHLFVCKAYF